MLQPAFEPLSASRRFPRSRLATALPMLCLSAFGASGGFSVSAVAQQERLILEEVVVTARRREELLQEVPISMTVFNQTQLDDANIVNAGDLATYTPSLQTNTRFGPDATVFQIRGFTQELRTTASVGVYFAEVIAPRGANTSTSGDGAGPGDFFDLQNVQVLKGPQGTLFGRNTTGGAVMLTPNRPTDELEGYLEGSAGNYDMWRLQGVLNVPAGDRVRLRFGVDHQERDGYLDNKSGIGPDEFADLDYTALRASMVVDITAALENYTIVKTLDSKNSNMTSSIFACNPEGSFGDVCVADLARRDALGANGWGDVWNTMPEPRSEIDQWQVINTTTWDVNDRFTVKNILSYAELETLYEGMVYGTDWQVPLENGGSQEIFFGLAGLAEGAKQGDSKTFVEELQFQGRAFEERLTWQAGLYYEKTKPKSDYGSQTGALIACDRSTMRKPDPRDWRCNDIYVVVIKERFGLPESLPLNIGSMTSAPGGVTYTNQAAYLQGTWDFSDQFSATAGIRYTDDKTEGYVQETVAKFPNNGVVDRYYPYESISVNYKTPETSSDEPTWLFGLDYKPTEDVLLYAKYARGYRQGSVNLAGVPPLDVHDPEKVDAYEIGAKTSFGGSVPGNFNIAAFYNDFQDQQVQFGFRNANGTGTTAIINAGKSTIWGVEIESAVLVADSLTLRASYTYLDTEVEELVTPEIDESIGDPLSVQTTTAEGEPLPYAPENQLVFSASYLLPFAPSLGDMSIAVTYVYNDEMQALAKQYSPYAVLDSYDLVNLNFNWIGIAGSPLDLSIFGTNITDEEYISFLTGNWGTGLESGQLGPPRMYGARLRYNF